MNIVVDIGNTRTKVGVFDRGVLVAQHYNPTPAVWESLQQVHIDQVMASSVGHGLEEVQALFEGRTKWITFDRSVKLPLTLHYDTPETLGLDRIAAAAGAITLYPNSPVLVIDAGSCITIDLITTDEVFCGGVISPGAQMRFKAMHAFTEKLPLVNWSSADQKIPMIPGLSTLDCLHGGVLKGIQFELQGYIEHYSGLHPDLKVVMTGGDAQYFENIINTPIFTEDSLVLIGLNRVLEYNVA